MIVASVRKLVVSSHQPGSQKSTFTLELLSVANYTSESWVVDGRVCTTPPGDDRSNIKRGFATNS